MRVSAKLLAALLAVAGCNDFCAVDQIQSAISPDRNWQVVVFGRNCGPTTAIAVHVSVLPATRRPKLGRGNVFRAGSDDQKVRLNTRGTPWAEASWTGVNEVTITYDDRERVFKKAERVGVVAVRYVARNMRQ